MGHAEVGAQVRAEEAERGGEHELGSGGTGVDIGEQPVEHGPQDCPQPGQEPPAGPGGPGLPGSGAEDRGGVGGEGREAEPVRFDEAPEPGSGQHANPIPGGGQTPAEGHAGLDITARTGRDDHHQAAHRFAAVRWYLKRNGRLASTAANRASAPTR
ncbi:hypothetical protein GCM10017567_24800 [Amycolatopsis bullii]|uniref:Uncharacterized protein n=1 Tax=Amycolatopsis bullii TaxID=941987 RepID=A0ABQ3K8W8_9PSEU|nr:hypothetical protein GCM10017567_24800 [Amycolatopsis bullii]